MAPVEDEAVRLSEVSSGTARVTALTAEGPCAPAPGEPLAWWAGAGLDRLGVAAGDRVFPHELDLAAGPGGGAFEVVFTPSRTTVVLHLALLSTNRTAEAAALVDAHREGVRAGLDSLQKQAGHAKTGYHGRSIGGRTTGRYIDASAWTVPVIDHLSARADTPCLHSHALVFTQIPIAGDPGSADAAWGTLDPAGLREALTMTAIVYDRAYEYAGARGLGLEYARRSTSARREITGISDELIASTLGTRTR